MIHFNQPQYWRLLFGLDQELTIIAVLKALVEDRPDINHSDRGLQYATLVYTVLLRDHGTKIGTAEVGKATRNAYAERLKPSFWRILPVQAGSRLT